MGKEEFRFLIDGFKPDANGVCIVDTDLEVDIEALNEEQARETLKRNSCEDDTRAGHRPRQLSRRRLRFIQGTRRPSLTWRVRGLSTFVVEQSAAGRI